LEEKPVMPIKRYKPEQIEAEITIQTFYRWRKEYGGLKMDQGEGEI
jgi:hypothetical protein